MSFKNLLLTGAVFALLAVIFGAFGAHALKDILSIEQQKTYETAIKYQFYHSQAIILSAILLYLFPKNTLFQWSGYLFSAGIILFSGSLFIYLMTNMQILVFLTPIGGLFFITAWLLMITSIFNMKFEKE